MTLDKTDLDQYWTVSADDRVRMRMLLWSLAFCTPHLLFLSLPSLALPDTLEVARPGVVAWAGAVLGIAALRGQIPLAQAVHVRNALGTLYFVFSAFFVSFVVIGLLRLLVLKRSFYASILVHLASMLHLLMYNGLSLEVPVVAQLSIAVGVVGCVYAVCAIAWIRQENFAVRQGWGGAVPDDRFSIAGESEGDVDDADAVMGEDDVLRDMMHSVEVELQGTERAILLHAQPAPPRIQVGAEDVLEPVREQVSDEGENHDEDEVGEKK